jgi:hypothetical protein
VPELEPGRLLLVVGERLQPVEDVDVTLDAPLERRRGEVGAPGEFDARLPVGLQAHLDPREQRHRQAAGQGDESDIPRAQGCLHAFLGGAPR